MNSEVEEFENIQETGTEALRPDTTADYYEDKNILISYDQFHFGHGLLGIRNFPERMAEVCLDACKRFKIKCGVALDAGCGPGRTAMELCKTFTKVLSLKPKILITKHFQRLKHMTTQRVLWT